MKKTVEINLPYYKQGSDLGQFTEALSPSQAMLAHAELLDTAANQLRTISIMIQDEVDIDLVAQDHTITLTGPKALVTRLVQAELAQAIGIEWDNRPNPLATAKPATTG